MYKNYIRKDEGMINKRVGLKLIAGVLLFSIVVSLCSVCFPKNALAASVLIYNSLDEVKEDLNVYKTIANGKISAIKVKNTWYYQFVRSGYSTVRIKTTAFTKTPKNNYLKADNNALTKQINTNSSRVCYYNKMKSLKRYSADGDSYNVYTTSMYRFLLEVQGLEDYFIMTRSKLTHGICFMYSTKVPTTYNPRKYVTPSNAEEYCRALTRTATGISEIVPTITLEVINTGDNNVCLSSYEICGVGNASTNENINSYIQIGKSIKNIVASAATTGAIGSFIALTSVIGNNKDTFTKVSKQYNSGQKLALSKGTTRTLKVKYESPITLSKTNDWVQIITFLNTKKFSNKTKDGKNAQFKVNFSFN